MALAISGLKAAIFDMDGVITRTADLHAAAWKKVFDELLARLASADVPFRPFDEHAEYRTYVDGKPRREGVHSFLHAREIALPPEEEEAVASKKDLLFEQLLREQGVQTFSSTLTLPEALRVRGVKIGVVTSSRHGREVLLSAGITDLFDACLDGIDLGRLGLKGKPNPDMFLYAGQALGIPPSHAVIIEDAVYGVKAGRRGGIAKVIGKERGDNATALQNAGADMVVQDLSEVDVHLLDAAFQAHQEKIAWRVEQEGFDYQRERQMECVFSVGNGYLGVRGGLDIPLPGSQCDLFIAGIYDRKRVDLPYSEIEFATPVRDGNKYAELVPLPFPFQLNVSVEGISLDFAGNYGSGFKRVLDLRCGVLHSEAIYETPGGRRTTVRTRRCASLADRHFLLQEATATPENHWGRVEFATSLLEQQWATYHPHIELLEHTSTPEMEFVHFQTRSSGFRICIASRTLRESNILRRMISVFTSRDQEDSKAASIAHSQSLDWKEFEKSFHGHTASWEAFWDKADIRVPGCSSVEQALRFGSYHLKIAASDDERVSPGARPPPGRAPAGHVFWDTEIFMLPIILHVDTEKANKILYYRFHTLDGERRRALSMGCRGACFAWESTVTGDDVTSSKIVLKSTCEEIPVFTGSQQLHVTADVAYAVWRYWEATQDEEFLFGPGAEILFETARFWHSRAVRGDRHYHIRGVIGPDEYHHSVNDNAYTNWMVRFNLERAAWLAQQIAQNKEEAETWTELATSLYIPAPNEHGIIEQFEGFFSLEDYPLPKNERFKAPVSRLFDWKKSNRVKLLKQADVLMLPLLFPESFSEEVVAANYHYYEPLSDHGSSLSPSVHAAIAARIGLQEDAERYWEQSLWLDLSNAMNNSMLGVHPAAMGGAWQALVFGFLGVRFNETDVLENACAAQRLPPGWGRVEMHLAYRGQMHAIEVVRNAERKDCR